MATRSLPLARAEVRTAALAAELLQLGVSGGLLVGEAASAVSLGDGLLFRGTDGVGESWQRRGDRCLTPTGSRLVLISTHKRKKLVSITLYTIIYIYIIYIYITIQPYITLYSSI